MKYNDDINDSNYSIFNAYNFFIAGDYVRVIILLYILFSFILNLIIIIAIFISKKKLSFVSKITLSIMGINFIHTFTYIYQWVVKIPNKSKEVGQETIGFLLTGNPNNMIACHTQAFFLISSSISQDFLINIFFYLINKSNLPNIIYIWLAVLILAFILPLFFTLMLLMVGALGINDRFCYVNKYVYNHNNPSKRYELYNYFRLWVTIVYSVRTINLIFSLYFFIKIIKYIMKKKMKLTYIFKMAYILLIQLVTISIGIIYRISSFFSRSFSANISSLYLILNTVDGVLFPFSFIITNGMHKILYKKITGKSLGEGEEEDEEESQYPNIDDDEENEEEKNEEAGKNIPMTDLSKYTDDKDNDSDFNSEDKVTNIGSVNS